MIKRDLLDKITLYLDSPEAIVITGMRRVGKTTLLRQIFDTIESKNKTFIDFEDINNRVIFEEQSYEKIKHGLASRNLDFGKQAYVFLDEIQYVKNTPSVVKYLIDHYQVKFFLTGSASYYLKNLFSESLAGRKYLFELFPLNFQEFLRFKNPNLSPLEKIKEISRPIFEIISPYYEEYLSFGGFPGVVSKATGEEKDLYLDDVFSSYFQFEVENLGDFKKMSQFRDFLLLLMERAGSKLSLSKLAVETELSRTTIYSYLSFLEGTYFLNLVRPYSRSRDVELRNAPKVYFCDTGLLRHLTRTSSGIIFENAVYNSLKSRGVVNYYQKKSGVEVDFILNKSAAFEVKETAGAYDLRNIKKIAADLKLPVVNVVTKNYAKSGATYGFLL